MNDCLHHLASRVGFRTLGQQLALLFALLLTLSVGGYSAYVGLEQADFIERLERSHADDLTASLAAALEPHVARGEATKIGDHLLQLEGNPRIRRATVTDRQGIPVASVRMGTDGAPRVEPLDGTPLTPPGNTVKPARQGSHIVAWASIGGNAPLGWLRLELAPAADENLAHILSDSVLAGILTLLGGTLAIRYFLRAPLRSLQRATAFAEGLEASHGNTLQDPGVVAEVRQLVDALNWTSIRLFDGQSALAASESRNRAITEAALDCIISTDTEGKVLEFNPAAERSFGISRAEALHQPIAELIFPERLREVQIQAVRDLLQTPASDTPYRRLEAIARHRDGREFPIEVALAASGAEHNRMINAYLRDISDRKHSEALMREAKETAEATSRSKSDFLANMSHEIRTPMNAILGMTDLALDTPLNDEQREYLTLVKSSANGLLGIINDILDFSKIEAGKLDFEHIDFSLRDCVALAVRTLQQRATEKHLKLSVEVAPDVPDSLIGDPHRLRQVLINLISNGIKFTPAGEVTVVVETDTLAGDGGQITLVFRVHDTGVGIPPEKQALIFDAFSQADTSTTRRYGGTGLGLTISAQLVQAMGGTIGVVSTPGEGSIFHFTARFELGQCAPVADEQAHLEGLPVLVAVDNPAERASLVELLGQWRMHPIPAPDAATAQLALERAADAGHPCRVALISTQLPDAEGFQLAEAIRGAKAAPPCIIMLAGEGRRGDGARCRELGVAAYLPMPALSSDQQPMPALASDLLDAILLSVDPLDEKADARPLITRHRLREQRRQLRVLLAEDNPVNRTLALRLLGKLGHQVDVANNGEEALALHARGNFDIILMDVQMPVMGGFEATARIREREAAGSPHTPIVAMTAHAMKGDRERCLEAGMDGYLSKPVHAPDLVEALIHHTGNADPAPPRSVQPMADDDPVFERDKALFNLGNDTDLLEQLIVMYAEDEPRLMQDIDTALAASDPEALSNAAHALKGAVSNFCAPRARASAERLEHLGRDKRLGEAPAALAALHQELTALRRAFGLEGPEARNKVP